MEAENNYLNAPYNSGNDQILVNNEMKNYLLETAKWAKFLAIVGFIIIGLMVVGAFTIGSILTAMIGNLTNSGDTGASPFATGGMGIMMTIYLLLIALLYFFPCLYLYQFSTRTQSALYKNLEIDLVFAFSRLKSFFKFIGVLMIIVLGFYALGIIGVLIGFASR